MTSTELADQAGSAATSLSMSPPLLGDKPRPRIGARLGAALPHLAAALAVVALLVLSRAYSYLLFHVLVEFFSIAIAFSILLLVWNTRDLSGNGLLRVIGVGYAAAACIDVVHTLAFKGMNIFPGYDADLPTQLWIAARFLQAGSLLAATLAYRRPVKLPRLLGGFGVLTVLLISAPFFGLFPVAYQEGVGLTPFKVVSEYLIVALLLTAAWRLWLIRGNLDPVTYRLILGSALCAAVGEMAFTFYTDVYDIVNMAGHLCKVAAYYLLYRAIYVTSIHDPFNTLFRELKASEQSLRASQELLRQAMGDEIRQLNADLERKVEERTAALEAANRELARLSMTDGLTGLANRRRFDEVLATEWARARRYSQTLALILIDIDYFKPYNDHYGHLAGDACLRQVADVLRAHARRPGDLAARYGGEEFACIAADTGSAGTMKMAETARAALERLALPHQPSPLRRITASFGVAVIIPDGNQGPEHLVRVADEALYRAKEGGRNRVIGPEVEPMGKGVSSVRLIWRAAYECGNPTIDGEHQELFRRANALLDLAVSDVPGEDFLAALDELLAHVVEHFAHEETILHRLGYAKVEHHAQLHRRLVDQAQALRTQAGAGGLGFGDLVSFLAMDVVARHMLQADRDFLGLMSKGAVLAKQKDNQALDSSHPAVSKRERGDFMRS